MTTENPFIAPSDNEAISADPQEFSSLGGLTRGRYWLAILVIIALTIIPLAGLLNLIIIPAIACYRMKNIGYHAALGLLIFIPIANIWAGIMCACAPTAYRYTKKLDTIGKILVVIFICLMVLPVVLAILTPNTASTVY